MSDEANIYDLGEIDAAAKRGLSAGGTDPRGDRRGRTTPRAVPAPSRVAAGSERNWPIGFALFVPGGGHLLKGEYDRGLFYLSSVGFLAAFAWAILASLRRLPANLAALGVPTESSVWTIGVLFLALAAIHVGSVFTVTRRLADAGQPATHPVVAGLASFAVPGWGQALTGHPRLAALFLSACWFTAGAWLLVAPPTQALLESQSLYLPGPLVAITSPLIRWVLPAVVWTLSVYDATLRASRT